MYNQKIHTNTQAGSGDDALPYKNQGLAGRATYAFKDTYFAEVNLGYNGSENFARGHRFGFFPAVAIGWMMSNEKWFQPATKVIDMLKLKASYGKVGNDDIGGQRRWVYESTIVNSGSWYYADPAWGDVDYQPGGARESVDYGYFLVPSRELFRTHTPEACFPLPECSDMADNYYVREGLYFTDADLEQAGQALETAMREGRESVTFKCAGREIYEKLYEELLTEQRIFQYLQGGAVSYAASEEQLALTFFL